VAGHRIPLAGAHQLDNLATAWEAIRGLQGLGFAIADADAWRGIEATRWPGRLWAVPGLADVIMDGAHNLDGTRTLAAHARATGVHPHLLFSAMGDKDLTGMAEALLAMEPASITLVRGDNPRYASAATLRAVWGAELEVLDIPTAAARLLATAPGPEHAGPRLVCGSLYFIGDLLRELRIKPQF
jgi:dihydrofolate synthase/folylpolyglutamate synthase